MDVPREPGGGASPAPTPSSPVDTGDQARPATPALAVRSYRPGDEATLVAMFSTIFRERSLKEWTWLFRKGPHGPADIHILESEGRTIGSVSHIPVDVWVNAEKLRLAIGCDVMVDREFRGLGGAELLFRTYHASEHGVDMNFGSVNAGSSHVTRRHMGTSTMGGVPMWVRSRKHGASRGPLRRALESAAGRIYAAVAAWPRPRTEVIDL